MSIKLRNDISRLSGWLLAGFMILFVPVAQVLADAANDAYNRQDYATAYRIWKADAEQGDVIAQYNYGRLFAKGQGVEQNDKQAVYWFRKAAARDHVYAQVYLGWMYRNGRGVEQDFNEAVRLYTKTADLGDKVAQYNLGLMYQAGEGVAKDDKKAAELFRKAAEQGDKEATEDLQKLLRRHNVHSGAIDGVYNDSIRVATQRFIDSASASVSTTDDAYGAYAKGDYATAYRLWKAEAEQGDAYAQFNLGTLYRDGVNVTQDDKQAVYWFRKAADQGNINAQYNLAWMYQKGRGHAQNDDEAVYWFRKAAAQGDTDAQVYLGWMYRNGRGVRQDFNEAVRLYTKTADLGDKVAQYNLGLMYQDGNGVAKDDKKAAELFRKAAEQGHKGAVEELQRILSKHNVYSGAINGVYNDSLRAAAQRFIDSASDSTD